MSLIEAPNGGYAALGSTDSFGSGQMDFLLIKTDEYGVVPEFPSWIVLPLFLITSLLVVISRKHLKIQS